MNRRLGGLLLLVLAGLTLPVQAQQQHAMHNMGGGPSLEVHTMPADDAVLPASPDSLMLHFPESVRLVKLALRNTEADLADIGFRYNPAAKEMFSQPLPELAASDYYTVEWAVLDDSDTLIKGRFYFSFGPDARAPSWYLSQQEEMLHIMAPDYRLLEPGAQ